MSEKIKVKLTEITICEVPKDRIEDYGDEDIEEIAQEMVVVNSLPVRKKKKTIDTKIIEEGQA